MTEWKKIADYFGDSYPAETPEANEAREVRMDYTRAPERPNEEYNWVATPDGIVLHPEEDHSEVFRLLDFPDESDPHAYGTLEVHQNWKALWDITQSNMAIHVLEKMLKRETKRHGWQMEGIAANGDFVSGQKTSMSLNPEALAQYPAVVQGTRAVENAVRADRDIDFWTPSRTTTDIPEDATFILRSLPLSEVYSNEAYDVEPRSGDQWTSIEGLEDDEADYYPSIQGEMEQEGDVPPLVVIKYGKGYFLIDGAHRMAMALHLGMTEFPAYVYDPYAEHTAAVEGIGEHNPGLMDWRTTDGDGNWGQDVEQVDYYGIDDPSDGPGMCPDCNMPLPNYAAWARHRVDHEPLQTAENSDEFFPADERLITPTHKMEVNGKVAMWPFKDPAQQYPFEVPHDLTHLLRKGDKIYAPGWQRYQEPGEYVESEVAYSDTHNMGSTVGYRLPKPRGRRVGPMRGIVRGGPSHEGDPIYSTMSPEDLTARVRQEQAMQQAQTELAQIPQYEDDWERQLESRIAKPQISGPMPFIYAVEEDHIYTGHPGERHSDIQGRFSPGGVVRGFYMPNGEMQIRSETDMGYTLYGMTRLWYYLYPELEIKSIKSWINGNLVKMASKDIAHTVINLLHADSAARVASEALLPHGEVYVVGGAVRDVILGKLPKDTDLLVAGIDQDTVVDLLSHLGKVDVRGQSFGVIGFRDNDGNEVELALPRTEHSTGPRRTDFEVVADASLPIERDLGRRDYSVNAIAVCVRTGRVVDPYDGAQDLAVGEFRLINDMAYEEDPTRLLRGLTLVSRHGLDPDPQTVEQMRQGLPHLAQATPESVGMELDKILAGDNPAKALRLGMDLGLLGHWLPEIQSLDGYDQRNKHHSRKLDDHTLTVVSNMVEISDDVDLRWAALLHDIGKPASQWVDDEGWAHYYHCKEAGVGQDHETVGQEMAVRVLKRLKFSNERIERISNLVGNHMFPVFTRASGARRFMAKAGPHAEDLMKLRWADAGGKNYDYAPQTQLMEQLLNHELARDSAVTVRDLAINGRDLMEMGYPQGARLGRTLDHLLERVIETPDLNDPLWLKKIARDLL